MDGSVTAEQRSSRELDVHLGLVAVFGNCTIAYIIQ